MGLIFNASRRAKQSLTNWIIASLVVTYIRPSPKESGTRRSPEGVGGVDSEEEDKGTTHPKTAGFSTARRVQLNFAAQVIISRESEIFGESLCSSSLGQVAQCTHRRHNNKTTKSRDFTTLHG
jgi:hypothetical protein